MIFLKIEDQSEIDINSNPAIQVFCKSYTSTS